jgi:hypothetical protein
VIGNRLRHRSVLIAAIVVALVGGTTMIVWGALRVERRPVAALPERAPGPEPIASGTTTPPAAAAPVSASPSQLNAAAVAAVRAKVERSIAANGNHASVAVYDRVTGLELTAGVKAHFVTASVVKVAILATVLLRHQGAGTKLTEDEAELATAMITRSDNASADELWEQIGGAKGLLSYTRRLGLSETRVTGGWLFASTTASDQIRMMRTIVDPAGPLSEASRDYLLGLMNRVVAAQRWGISKAATKQSTVYLKNGWVTATATDPQWGVNSVGRIVEPGHDWLVAVLSDRHVTMAAGVTVVERVASLSVGGLRAVR